MREFNLPRHLNGSHMTNRMCELFSGAEISKRNINITTIAIVAYDDDRQ